MCSWFSCGSSIQVNFKCGNVVFLESGEIRFEQGDKPTTKQAGIEPVPHWGGGGGNSQHYTTPAPCKYNCADTHAGSALPRHNFHVLHVHVSLAL